MKIISLGGGVQSSTLTLLAHCGEIDKADCAVFADTGWERNSTYDYVHWLSETVDMPIYTISGGDIRSDMLNASKNHWEHMPLYTDSGTKSGGQLRRQCTNHYKITPIKRFIRERYGFRQFELWLGISVDEVARMKPSRVKYITHRFPLIERRWGRGHCIEWLKSKGFPVPSRSSCIGCPYHSDAEWDDLTELEKKDAFDFDDRIRDKHLHRARRKDFKLYLHRSLVPLRQVQFANHNQLDFLKNEECEGGCFL